MALRIQKIDDDGMEATREYHAYPPWVWVAIAMLGGATVVGSLVLELRWLPVITSGIAGAMLLGTRAFGATSATYRFDHEKRLITVVKNGQEENTYAYAQANIRKKIFGVTRSGRLQANLPSNVEYVVDLPGVRNDFDLPISPEDIERFEEFLATYLTQRAESREEELVPVPKGAISNAGSPVAVSASTKPPKE